MYFFQMRDVECVISTPSPRISVTFCHNFADTYPLLVRDVIFEWPQRHIKRKNGEEFVKDVQSNHGSCLCLECGHRCLRIRDLQYHLIYIHNHTFRFETKIFESVQGA